MELENVQKRKVSVPSLSNRVFRKTSFARAIREGKTTGPCQPKEVARKPLQRNQIDLGLRVKLIPQTPAIDWCFIYQSREDEKQSRPRWSWN